MLDGFFQGSKYGNLSKKQALEVRLKESVLNLVIERNPVFLDVARKYDTSIIVNNRDGLIEEFDYNDRHYISLPTSLNDELDEMSDDEAESYLDGVLKTALTKSELDNESHTEDEILIDKFRTYKHKTSEETGLESTLLDEYGNVIKNIFSKPAVRDSEDDKTEKEKEDMVNDGKQESDSKSSCDLTPSGIKNETISEKDSKVELNVKSGDNVYSFQDVDSNPDGNLPSDVKPNLFLSNNNAYLTDKEEMNLKALANQVLKSFKGRVSKEKTTSISKRILSKSLITDNSEKIYMNKKGKNGKELNINLILDMSGSMGGTPVRNALKMVYLFNEIALRGKLKGSVIWSESSNCAIAEFPIPRDFIRKMGRTGGGEGLGENMKKHQDILKKADINICMTDGSITDSPITREENKKKKIYTLGVYVNSKADNLLEYTGSLDRWFDKSLVRKTFKELAEKLIQIGLRKKG